LIWFQVRSLFLVYACPVEERNKGLTECRRAPIIALTPNRASPQSRFHFHGFYSFLFLVLLLQPACQIPERSEKDRAVESAVEISLNNSGLRRNNPASRRPERLAVIERPLSVRITAYLFRPCERL